MTYITKNSRKSTSTVDREIEEISRKYIKRENKLSSSLWIYVLIITLISALSIFTFLE